MSLYKGKYRIESTRLKNYDYSAPGVYFITMVTKYRKPLFGKIINKQMLLSPLGEIAFREWNTSFKIRSNFRCDGFVIMPDHIHGIITIKHPVRRCFGEKAAFKNQPRYTGLEFDLIYWKD